jgi:hypothetical protein
MGVGRNSGDAEGLSTWDDSPPGYPQQSDAETSKVSPEKLQ